MSPAPPAYSSRLFTVRFSFSFLIFCFLKRIGRLQRPSTCAKRKCSQSANPSWVTPYSVPPVVAGGPAEPPYPDFVLVLPSFEGLMLFRRSVPTTYCVSHRLHYFTPSMNPYSRTYAWKKVSFSPPPVIMDPTRNSFFPDGHSFNFCLDGTEPATS